MLVTFLTPSSNYVRQDRSYKHIVEIFQHFYKVGTWFKVEQECLPSQASAISKQKVVVKTFITAKFVLYAYFFAYAGNLKSQFRVVIKLIVLSISLCTDFVAKPQTNCDVIGPLSLLRRCVGFIKWILDYIRKFRHNSQNNSNVLTNYGLRVEHSSLDKMIWN